MMAGPLFAPAVAAALTFLVTGSLRDVVIVFVVALVVSLMLAGPLSGRHRT